SHACEITPVLVRPPYRRCFSRVAGSSGLAANLDRALNRFVFYPRYVNALRDDFDVLHIIDHSYAHLAAELPAARVVVTCHDLDAFACPLDTNPAAPRWYPPLARRLLAGLQQASRVICDTEATRDGLIRHQLVNPQILPVIVNGVDSICSSQPYALADREA